MESRRFGACSEGLLELRSCSVNHSLDSLSRRLRELGGVSKAGALKWRAHAADDLRSFALCDAREVGAERASVIFGSVFVREPNRDDFDVQPARRGKCTALKGSYFVAKEGRSLREHRDGASCFEMAPNFANGPCSAAAAFAIDKNRSRSVREPAHQRPACDVATAQNMASEMSQQDSDIKRRTVVRHHEPTTRLGLGPKRNRVDAIANPEHAHERSTHVPFVTLTHRLIGFRTHMRPLQLIYPEHPRRIRRRTGRPHRQSRILPPGDQGASRSLTQLSNSFIASPVTFHRAAEFWPERELEPRATEC